eukprot:767269-Hanusia_phi.AAC.1
MIPSFIPACLHRFGSIAHASEPLHTGNATRAVHGHHQSSLAAPRAVVGVIRISRGYVDCGSLYLVGAVGANAVRPSASVWHCILYCPISQGVT